MIIKDTLFEVTVLSGVSSAHTGSLPHTVLHLQDSNQGK